MSEPFIIAIDGPSASGKGTIARRVAAHFDFAYLDTGLLYRAVGMAVVRASDNPSNPDAAEKAARILDTKMLTDPALRNDEASVAASKVAAIPAVRAALLQFQKDYCKHPPEGKKGAVLDGRDIGTVIAPNAPCKIYITASAEARAERRFKELQARGLATSYDAVLKDMQERDARDMSRAAAPLKPAPDAVTIDTTAMGIDEVVAKVISFCQRQIALLLE